MSNEEWRPVRGYPHHDISSIGRLRSWLSKNGRATLSAPRIVCTWIKPNGYPFAILYRNGKRRQYFIHTLVLEAFSGPRPAGMVVRHFPDPTRTNVAITNLSWGTYKQNTNDSFEHGTFPQGARSGPAKHPELYRGEFNGRHKLTSTEALAIYCAVGKQRDIAKTFGVSQKLVLNIKKSRTWAHVTGVVSGIYERQLTAPQAEARSMRQVAV
jgi:hypothetical protein